MQTVTTFTQGDIDVLLEQRADGTFRVTYGHEVHDQLSYVEAAKEFGECVFHSLACVGKLDTSHLE